MVIKRSIFMVMIDFKMEDLEYISCLDLQDIITQNTSQNDDKKAIILCSNWFKTPSSEKPLNPLNDF